MSNRISKEKRVEQANIIHNNKYNYSMWADSITLMTIVEIVCPIHGTFMQLLKSHIQQKCGCPKCVGIGLSIKERINKANQIHNNKYDYSKLLLKTTINVTKLVEIICPIHGNFQQSLDNHINNKHGCPKCSGDKTKKTNKNRYGVEYVLQSEKIKEKSKRTCLKKYNTENPMQSETIKKKVKQTMLKRYNVEHALQSPLFHEKAKQTCFDNYGVYHPQQSDDIRKKTKKTNKDKYDVEYVLQSDKVKDKSKETCLSKYNVPHVTQRFMGEESLNLLNNKKWLIGHHHTLNQTLKEISNSLDVNVSTVSNYFKKHNIEVKYFFQSVPEQEIKKFIEGFYDDTIKSSARNIIPPYELDIYIPEHKLAIEYCGLYWHSEQAGKDKHYHKRKYDMCKKQGIQLITIFEDEWFTREEQIKSKIKSLLHKDTSHKIFARKTQIINVSRRTKQVFYNDNHIQGDGPSSIDIGLMCDNVLVACMSFIKTENEYNLNRFATACRVPGGFSKLLSHFIKEHNPESIISFADLRWSTGNLYLKTGWSIDKILKPDYSYSPDAKLRHHKFKYRRKNLPKLLNDFNPELSERVNCDNNGILRIWDCGKIRFKYPPLTL